MSLPQTLEETEAPDPREAAAQALNKKVFEHLSKASRELVFAMTELERARCEQRRRCDFHDIDLLGITIGRVMQSHKAVQDLRDEVERAVD